VRSGEFKFTVLALVRRGFRTGTTPRHQQAARIDKAVSKTASKLPVSVSKKLTNTNWNHHDIFVDYYLIYVHLSNLIHSYTASSESTFDLVLAQPLI
jgi:hypothetical protein